MKTDKFVLQEKKFIKLEKRSYEIRQIKHKTQWKEIEEPYQDGWELSLSLRDHVKNREKLLEILKQGSYSYITRDPSIITKIRKNPRLSNVKNILRARDGRYNYLWHYYGPHLQQMSAYRYDKLPEDIQRFFYRVEHQTPNRWGGEPYIHYTYFPDISEKDMIVKCKKRIVTHIQDINPEILREEAEIEAQLSDFYRTSSWNGYKYDDNDKFGANIQRRHSKDALRKVIKSEMEDITEYKKLGTNIQDYGIDKSGC